MDDKEQDNYDRKYFKRKLSSLTGGVALIEVGAPTEVEMIERKDRIDDAVEALRSSVDRGICVGGGYTFGKCYFALTKKVKDEVRDKYGKDDMKNCMHSSDSKENVEREADICFKINNELDNNED